MFTREKAEEIVQNIRSVEFERAVDIFLEFANNYSPEPSPSPLTPSGAIPVYLKPNHKKRRRKPGQKKGHPGKSRPVPDHIDQYKEHKLEYCPHCGTAVNDPVEKRTKYVEEIPPVKPVVTEHTIHRYWCSSCKKIVEPVFTEAMPHDNIGLRVYLFTAYMHYALGVSVGNLVKILNQFFQFRLSPGALTKGWQRVARLLRPEYQSLRRKAKKSAVLNIDETGWRLNGDNYWLWCFTNKTLCYYVIAKSRGSIVIKKVLGKIFQGTLVCDFWSAYNKFLAWAKQRCFFHIFTDLEKVDKRNDSVEWEWFRCQIYSLLQKAVRLWEGKANLSPEQFQRRQADLEKHFDRVINMGYNDADCRRLCGRFQEHRGELFTFMNIDGVSPYNNHAEQQMRKPVMARRICQQNRSAKGAEAQSILMSIFRTAELQGKNPILTVSELVKEQIFQEAKSKVQGKKAA